MLGLGPRCTGFNSLVPDHSTSSWSSTLHYVEGLENGPEFIEGRSSSHRCSSIRPRAHGREVSVCDLMYYVYFLKNSDNKLYVGCTHDIQSRILRHQSGDGAEFTNRNKVFNLVYSEEFATLLEARKREKQIKGWRREKKENLIKFGKPNIVK